MKSEANYPINAAHSWPRNQWWIAANAEEVTRAPMERTILGEPVTLFRTEAGLPKAVFGMCPHRGYPMVKAKVVGDTLECGYHGFTFDVQGRCTRVPSQDQVPEKWSIRSYPVEQRWQWIWIWTGDPRLADPAKIPDPWCVGKPGWKTQAARRDPLGSRYTLLIDNLFDLSHLNFLHASLVGDVSALVRAPFEISTPEAGAQLRLLRKVNNSVWTGYFSFMFPDKAGQARPVYAEALSDYFGPCLTVTGGPFFFEDTREKLGEMCFMHAMTPETESTTHYFGGVTRDFRLDDAAFDPPCLGMYLSVRQQDLEALAMIEPLVRQFGSTTSELSALQDAGGVRVRRLLKQQIEEEAKVLSQ